MPPVRALYVGYTSPSTQNHGDEALQWIIRDLLAPEIDVRANWTDFDVAVLGGGTLINQSPWIAQKFEQALAKAGTGRGIALGTGVGDFVFWGNDLDRWRPLLERCDVVGVRGPLGARLLWDNHFENIIDCGDPYLWLKAPIERPFTPGLLGVNIGLTGDSHWGGSDGDLQEVVTKTLHTLASSGWKFHVFSVWSRDVPLMQSLASDLGPDVVLGTYNVRADPLEAYSALAACEIFLGEKLHACAMAAVAGVPFIAMEYQPKVRDFTASIGMDDPWTVSTKNLAPAQLTLLVEKLSSLRADVKKSMTAARDERRNRIVALAKIAKAAFSQQCSVVPQVKTTGPGPS